MILDLVVEKGIDGFSAVVPSLEGCESWAHDEDTALEKITEMVAYYLGVKNLKKIKLDLARKEEDSKIYKIIISDRH